MLEGAKPNGVGGGLGMDRTRDGDLYVRVSPYISAQSKGADPKKNRGRRDEYMQAQIAYIFRPQHQSLRCWISEEMFLSLGFAG